MKKIAENFILILLFLMTLFIVINNVFLSYRDYITKKFFILPPVLILLLSAVLLLINIFFINRYRDKKSEKLLNIFIIFGLLFLFSVQLVIGNSLLFISETWDVYDVMESAIFRVVGSYDLIDNEYFSAHPNNIGMMLFEVFLFRIFNGYNKIRAVYIGFIFQTALTTLNGFLLFDIARRRFKNKSPYFPIFTFLLYTALIGFSGWSMVFYTDITGMFFPIFIFYLYDRLKDIKKTSPRIILMILISASLYIGYKIKPTILIIGIAIFIILLINKEKRLLPGALIFIITILLITIVFNKAVSYAGLSPDKEKDVGALHMFMMGLNEENDGAFYFEDIRYSMSFQDKDERTKGQLLRIKERLKNYGVKGLFSHLERKALVVFNDGTFAWGEESNFFEEKFYLLDNNITDFLERAYYPEGDLYNVRALLSQIIYYMLLLMILIFTPFIKRDKESFILLLSVLGIFIFDMLFEARARYLIIYVPVMILYAVFSLEGFLERAHEKRK